MNIKSLLIGSAAATAAVSGAQAADAIVIPQPEPMEYVRVCDVYGAGFFYIPGTETCLKIGGYARYEISWAEGDDGWKKMARGTLTVDARSETEYGTLGGFIELRAQTQSGFTSNEGYVVVDDELVNNDVDNYVQLQQAIISLGGLSMGVSDTLYDAGLSGEFDSGGGDRVHFIRYTFDAANGVFVSVALEEADYNLDYTPNVVGSLGVAQGWGSVTAWGAYDATAEEWAAKGIASINATSAITLELLGTYESGNSFYSVSNGGNGGYEWSAGGYVKFAATPKMSIGFGGQYFVNEHGTDLDDYALGAVLDYEIVENFDAKLAVNYRDGDNFGDDNNWSGFARFTRSF
ncbi:porin [Nitratireductor basaltis]|uniref:Porin n=1 Tax=Nitratireductor basaltis TaxID=472175 RepID=A0A084UCB1_9HYPH|nr:porin [Nitratireductor basaltis]KFB10597.1 Porin precursor [Nitratireductor basaltis]